VGEVKPSCRTRRRLDGCARAARVRGRRIRKGASGSGMPKGPSVDFIMLGERGAGVLRETSERAWVPGRLLTNSLSGGCRRSESQRGRSSHELTPSISRRTTQSRRGGRFRALI